MAEAACWSYMTVFGPADGGGGAIAKKLSVLYSAKDRQRGGARGARTVVCSGCGSSFPTRNTLFRHLRDPAAIARCNAAVTATTPLAAAPFAGACAGAASARVAQDAAEEAAWQAATHALRDYAFYLADSLPAATTTACGDGDVHHVAQRLPPARPFTSPVVLLTETTRAFRHVAASLPNPLTDIRIVDIGSAYGDATQMMADAMGDSSRVLGVDVGAQFVLGAAQRFPQLHFEQLDVLEDGMFAVQALRDASVVFVDIGGVREAEALVRLLALVASTCRPRAIVVKSEELVGYAREASAAAHDEEEQEQLPASGNEAVVFMHQDQQHRQQQHRRPGFFVRTLPPTFWEEVCRREAGNIRARSSWKSACPNTSSHFGRYPLKYPRRFVRASLPLPDAAFSAEIAAPLEICRFHNYSPEGCKRMLLDTCSLDHTHCHFCYTAGHAAITCAEAATARAAAVADSALAPAASPVRNPNDGTAEGGTSDEVAYIYVVGGRNRGRTVGVTERLSLSTREWQRGPHLQEPRGSLGLAAVGSRVFAVGGGGMKGNLISCEMIDAATPTASPSSPSPSPFSSASRVPAGPAWGPAGSVREPRHALSACAAGGGIYAVGGWVYGDHCTGAVDFLRVPDGTELVIDTANADAQQPALVVPKATSSVAAAATDSPPPSAVQWQWEPRASLLLPRKLYALAAYGSGNDFGLYVFGGRIAGADSHHAPCAAAERYDPAADAWTSIAPLPNAGCGSAAAVAGHGVFIALWGGEGSGTRNDGGLYRYDPQTDAYANLGRLPLPEWFGFSMASHGRCVFLLGGSTLGRWTGAAWCYDVTASVWEELPPMKIARRRCAAAVACISTR